MQSLTTVQRQDRLNFACKNLSLDWSRVIFSGEKKVGSVNIWASISEYGPHKMRYISDSFSSAQYVSILDDIVLPLRNQTANMIFMQVMNHNYYLLF